MDSILSVVISDKLFPTILFILDACAGIRYAIGKDLWMAGYWFSAAALTFIVTYRPH